METSSSPRLKLAIYLSMGRPISLTSWYSCSLLPSRSLITNSVSLLVLAKDTSLCYSAEAIASRKSLTCWSSQLTISSLQMTYQSSLPVLYHIFHWSTSLLVLIYSTVYSPEYSAMRELPSLVPPSSCWPYTRKVQDIVRIETTRIELINQVLLFLINTCNFNPNLVR